MSAVGPSLVERHLVSMALVFAAAFSACHRGSSPSASDEAGPAPATSAVSVAAAAGGDCLTTLDFLVPYQSYKNGDVIRAMVVDGDQVLFRNADDLMRVPLRGGPPVVLGPAPSMTLQLDSRPTMWIVGDKIVSQSPGAPAFLEAPKSGGAWTPIINLKSGDLGSELETGQHVVHTVFSGTGTSFYWVEGYKASKGKPASNAIRAVPLSGPPVKTLYEWQGALKALARVGDRLVFERTDLAPPPVSEPAHDLHAAGKAKPVLVNTPAPPTMLMSMAAQGGKPEELAHFSSMTGSISTGDVLFSDGDTLYLTGFENEDFTKGGLFRISAHAGSALERLDDRELAGQGFVYGDRFVIAGQGRIEARQVRSTGEFMENHGIVVLTGDRRGGALQRVACIRGNYSVHAYAVAGKSLLISIFKSDEKAAAIVRVALP
jgi:hypothetical protein